MTALVELLRDLVAIDSTNPRLVQGAAGEMEIAGFIAAWAERRGLGVELELAAPRRPNVYVTARGRGGGRTLLLNAHTDIVGTEGMHEPFTPRIAGNRLYGRGGYDMKAGLAAALVAAATVAGDGLAGDVVVACVCDEEHGSIGTETLVRAFDRLRPDFAVVTEPTELEVVVAHRGFVWLEVDVTGVAAHGSRPHLGVDAIAKAARIMVELERHDLVLRAVPRHRYLGSGSLHAAKIAGGHEWSSIPASCTLTVERRTIPGETAASVAAEVQRVVDGLARVDPSIRATVRCEFDRPPFEIADDATLVQAITTHARAAGAAAPLAGASYWADAALIAEAGVDTVLFGPIGDGAHATSEWVDLASVEICARTLTDLARDLCAADAGVA